MRKQRAKYPKVLKNVVEISDIILEVLDARFIKDTRNRDIEDAIIKKRKSIIYIINKSDLIDRKKIEIALPNPHVFISCKNRTGTKNLRNRIKAVAKKIEKPAEEKARKVTIGVIGYPNTGKSSIINILIGKKSAPTASQAGFTKGMQKLKLTPEIMLLDSPGVIPQSEYSTSERWAIIKQTKVGGRSYNQVKDPEFVVASLMKEFKGIFEKYYKINAEDNAEILIEELGRKKGFLKRGGTVDEDKTTRYILKDWQEGRIKV